MFKKSSHKLLLGVIFGILLLLGGYLLFQSKNSSPENLPESREQVKNTEASITPNTDIQASFAIFTNGTFRVFTAAMYHNLSQDVYIEAINPNIVRVKKTGTTWNDFFSTLPFSLTSECLTTGTKETFCTGSKGTLQFYLNGVKSTDVLNQVIHDGDKLLVTFGNESEAEIRKQVERIP